VDISDMRHYSKLLNRMLQHTSSKTVEPPLNFFFQPVGQHKYTQLATYVLG